MLHPENFALCVPQRSGFLYVQSNIKKVTGSNSRHFLLFHCHNRFTISLPERGELTLPYRQSDFSPLTRLKVNCQWIQAVVGWLTTMEWFTSELGSFIRLAAHPTVVCSDCDIVVPSNFVQWLWFCRSPGENWHAVGVPVSYFSGCGWRNGGQGQSVGLHFLEVNSFFFTLGQRPAVYAQAVPMLYINFCSFVFIFFFNI